tara:strand:+ start:208 stop:1191 length:984 start_codon:yes stop_codon:yes gene_type:complete
MKFLLKSAIKKRLDSIHHGEVAFLLSGGLDSSIVVALTREIYGPDYPIHTYSIGLDPVWGNSSDTAFAEEVAKYCNTIHTSFSYTLQEGKQAYDTVVTAFESLCTTSIRAGIPNYLLIKKIKEKNKNVKIVMSGEGSDELMLGYLSCHEFQSIQESMEWSTKLMKEIHFYDVKRCHQSGMAHSCEVRVPFLDKQFVSYIRSVKSIYLLPVLGVEKYFLRQVGEGILPQSVLRRTKTQFSDGVGSLWIETLRDRAYWRQRSIKESILTQYAQPIHAEEQLNIWDSVYNNLGPQIFKDLSLEHRTWVPGVKSKNQDPSGAVRDAMLYTK